MGESSERPADVVLVACGPADNAILAFAYTYHYLNWFSKNHCHWLASTEELSCQQDCGSLVGMRRLYVIDFSLGLTVVGMLSLLHVFFEFPLNWLSIRGLTRESRAIWVNGWRTQLGDWPIAPGFVGS